MGEATKTTLGDLAKAGHLEFGDGYRTKRAEHGKPGIPILRVAEVLDGKILPALEDYVSDAYRDSMGQKISQPGDVVLTTKGTVGRVAIMPSNSPEFVYSPQLCYFRLRPGSPLLARYLYYWFKSEQFWSQARSRKSQTDMADYLNLADIRSLEISLPELREQQAVTSVLGALDDKIAVNERIARTSLDLADAHFELVARNLAYSSETFGSVAEVFGGGTPRTSEPAYWDGSIAWATPSDVTGLSAPYLFTTARKITEKGLAECASQLYPPGSIFMTSRATIGAFAVPQVPTAVNQGFIVVIPRQPEMRWWLFHEMRSRVDEMRSLANGSTFLELSRKNFKAMRVRLAEPDVIARFSAQVDPLHKRAAKCVEESHVLAELRDTLLPKLMSGEIRVRDAEKAVEESL